MNKDEYIKKLSSYLGRIPENERQDVINDFEEHFKEGISEGRTEENIADSLGDPKTLANQLRASILLSEAEKTTSATNITRAVFATLGMGFFNLIFVLGPFIAIFGIVVALFALSIGITATGIAVFFASIFGPLLPQYFVLGINTAVAIFSSMGVTCMGILFFTGNVYLARILYRLFLRYIRFNLRIVKGRK
jgi:uncharacterized membrane protein